MRIGRPPLESAAAGCPLVLCYLAAGLTALANGYCKDMWID